MGRWSTGAWSTTECKRINISSLIKNQQLKKGYKTMATVSWTCGSEITVICDMTGGNSYIRLIYTTTYHNGTEKQFDYTIQVVSIPSNLGKGNVLYFICPVTFRRCRILYKAYGSDIWKSREGHSNRIYYPGQLSSKLDKYNDRYWELDRQIKKLSEQRRTYTYMGIPTRRAEGLDSLINEQMRVDELRWSMFAIPKRLQGQLGKWGIVKM